MIHIPHSKLESLWCRNSSPSANLTQHPLRWDEQCFLQKCNFWISLTRTVINNKTSRLGRHFGMSGRPGIIKWIHGEVILCVVTGNVACDHSMIARLCVRLKVAFDPHMLLVENAGIAHRSSQAVGVRKCTLTSLKIFQAQATDVSGEVAMAFSPNMWWIHW